MCSEEMVVFYLPGADRGLVPAQESMQLHASPKAPTGIPCSAWGVPPQVFPWLTASLVQWLEVQRFCISLASEAPVGPKCSLVSFKWLPPSWAAQCPRQETLGSAASVWVRPWGHHLGRALLCWRWGGSHIWRVILSDLSLWATERSLGSQIVFLEAKGIGMFAFPGEGWGGRNAVSTQPGEAVSWERLSAEQLQGEQFPVCPNSHHSFLACSREPFLPEIDVVSERRHKAGNSSLWLFLQMRKEGQTRRSHA